MKKVIFVVLFMACSMFGAAYAANPELVFATNASGQQVIYGAGTLLGVRKDPGTMRTLIRYAGGEQYIADDAAWSKHAKFVAACGSRCMAVPGSAIGQYVNVVDSTGIYCQNNTYTQITYANTPVQDIPNDGCAFWLAVKANSQ